ncbi:hypothetical protein [Bacteroides sp.]|uniref:hypothetical protein n=1 Tax=Bacteroides sp. TaxID=29523 RepID=UPI00260A438C|nr:hypothetical protein [Bacteroides sp.]MDD3039751.1 hypothetical protein [Bacteroides sp.]
MSIGLVKGYTAKQYADLAAQANAEGKLLKITETGDVEIVYPTYTLAEKKVFKLKQISQKTKEQIVGGFISTATGGEVTFDSDEATQSTMQTMYAATQSPDFANHPVYQGVIPVRGFAEGSTIKTVFYLNATQVQKFMDDLALHIGKCKQEGWAKQALVEVASTVEELEQIVL